MLNFVGWYNVNLCESVSGFVNDIHFCLKHNFVYACVYFWQWDRLLDENVNTVTFGGV